MPTDHSNLEQIIASLLFSSDRRLSKNEILEIIASSGNIKAEANDIENAIKRLENSFNQLAIDIQHSKNGYRLQTKKEYASWVSLLWKEKAPKYSKALLETLSLIAYRQPITRGEIEHVRGVSVSSYIIRTLLDRKWVRVIGHREVPGRPALYGTTRDFLDYFNIASLSDLPSLPELKSIEDLDKAMQQLISEEQVKKEPNPDKTEQTNSLLH